MQGKDIYSKTIYGLEHNDNAAHVYFLVKNEGRQLGEVKKQKKYFWKFAA
jgi:hypothetical protein